MLEAMQWHASMRMAVATENSMVKAMHIIALNKNRQSVPGAERMREQRTSIRIKCDA